MKKWKNKLLNLKMNLRHHPVVEWVERVIYCHHNARVLADLEWKMSLILDTATNGMISKPYTDDDVIREYIAKAKRDEYRAGYNDCREDFDITEGEPA